MAQSFSTVSNIIQQFIDKHESLQGRGAVATYDNLTNFAHQGTQFPLMYADIRDVYLDDNANIYTFRVYCVDLLQKDRSNEGYVRNHTLAILTDFRNWIAKDLLNNIRVLSSKPRAVPVNNFLMDYTSGWYYDIQFETTSIISDCVIPFDGHPQFSGTTCEINYVAPFLTCGTLQYCSNYIDIINNSVTTNLLSAATLNAGIILSGGTNLYDIFNSDIVRVQPGINTFTGGTPVNPTVNVTGVVLSVSAGTNIITGGTQTNPTISTSLSPTFNSLSASSLSGDNIYSGSTNINTLFGSGSNILLGKSNIVYIFGSASDAAAAGGASNNAFTTFQAAYNKANQMATASTAVLLSVLNTTSGNTGNLILTADYNTNIRVEGYSFNTSLLGSIITSASTGSSFNLGGTGVTQAALFSNINLGNIITTIGSSGNTNNSGRVNIALNNVLMGNINTSVPVANWAGNGGNVMIGGSGTTLANNTTLYNTTVGRVGNITTQARIFSGNAGSVVINAPQYNFGTITTAVNNNAGAINITNASEIVSVTQTSNSNNIQNILTNVKNVISGVGFQATGGTSTLSNVRIAGGLSYIGLGTKTFNVTDTYINGGITSTSATTLLLNNVYTGNDVNFGGSSQAYNCNFGNNLNVYSGSTSLTLIGCQIRTQMFIAGVRLTMTNSNSNSAINDVGLSSMFANCGVLSDIFVSRNSVTFQNCGLFRVNFKTGVTGCAIYTCGIDPTGGLVIPVGTTVNYTNSFVPAGSIVGGGAYVDLEQDIAKTTVSATTLSAETYYSGTTGLDTIIDRYSVRVQPGTNIITGGTANAPTINTVASPSFTNVSGVSFYSGSTNLSTLFTGLGGGGSSSSFLNPTRVGFGNSSSGLTGSSLFTWDNTSKYIVIDSAMIVGMMNSTYYGMQANNIGLFSQSSNSIFFIKQDGSIQAVSPAGFTVSHLLSSGSFSTPTLSAVTIQSNSLTGATTQMVIASSGGVLSTQAIPSPGTQTLVQPGTNITTGGTASAPTVNVVASPSFTNVSATTLYSGSTDLSTLINAANDITRVQQGFNIMTGGTANAPEINVVASPSFITVEANNFTSGGTNISNFFTGLNPTKVQPGFNTYTGGTAVAPTVNISAATLVSISGGTISGGTLYSGSTDLSTLIINSANNNTTRIQNGLNTYTGGTAIAPSINISAATLSTINVSGTSTQGLVNLSKVVGTDGSSINYLPLLSGNSLSAVTVVVSGYTFVGGNLFVGSSIPGPIVHNGITTSGSLTQVTQNAVGIYLTEGGSAPVSGIATLVTGKATVLTTKVTSTCRIFLSYNTSTFAQIGFLFENVSQRAIGTSFEIDSSNPLDVSDVAWFLIDRP